MQTRRTKKKQLAPKRAAVRVHIRQVARARKIENFLASPFVVLCVFYAHLFIRSTFDECRRRASLAVFACFTSKMFCPKATATMTKNNREKWRPRAPRMLQTTKRLAARLFPASSASSSSSSNAAATCATTIGDAANSREPRAPISYRKQAANKTCNVMHC